MKKQRIYLLLTVLLSGFYTYAWDPDDFGPEPPPDDVAIDHPLGAFAAVVLILFVLSKVKWPKTRLDKSLELEPNEHEK